MSELKIEDVLLQNSKPSIFQLMSKIAIDNNALNFGQGFPNWTVPDIIADNLEKQLANPQPNNVAYSFGTKFLLETLEKEYSPLLKQNLKWDQNILVSAGATPALGYLFALTKPDEEMIIMEPFFPWYKIPMEMFKGKIRYVRLKETVDLKLDVDFDEIESLCSKKTRYLLINSPQNPTGKIFYETHFERIREIVQKYKNIIIISDEVYEHVEFTGKPFPRLGAYKDLWDRTISVYSGGKTYSCTGWRLGWAIGPEVLISPLKEIQRITNNQTNGLLMDTIAQAIRDSDKPYKGFDSYYAFLNNLFTKNKDMIVTALRKSNLEYGVIEPDGGHFVVANISKSITHMPIKYFYKDGESSDEIKLTKFEDWRTLNAVHYKPDEAFSSFLTVGYKITPIPCSAFYALSKNDNDNQDECFSYIRLAICKKTEDVIELVKRFAL